MIKVSVAGQTFQLLPERGAYWQEEEILIVSDLHLGKTSTMQVAGMPVPEGTMEDDLRRLLLLIKKNQPKKCIIVGDLVHARRGLTERVQTIFKNWLSHIHCGVELVLGNHDAMLKKTLPAGWNITVHSSRLIVPPFCFAHIPMKCEPYFVWSGHIHPQILLKSSFDQMTLRCFYFTANQAILPAFSDFVGGAYIKKTPDSVVYGIAGQEVILI